MDAKIPNLKKARKEKEKRRGALAFPGSEEAAGETALAEGEEAASSSLAEERGVSSAEEAAEEASRRGRDSLASLFRGRRGLSWLVQPVSGLEALIENPLMMGGLALGVSVAMAAYSMLVADGAGRGAGAAPGNPSGFSARVDNPVAARGEPGAYSIDKYLAAANRGAFKASKPETARSVAAANPTEAKPTVAAPPVAPSVPGAELSDPGAGGATRGTLRDMLGGSNPLSGSGGRSAAAWGGGAGAGSSSAGGDAAKAAPASSGAGAGGGAARSTAIRTLKPIGGNLAGGIGRRFGGIAKSGGAVGGSLGGFGHNPSLSGVNSSGFAVNPGSNNLARLNNMEGAIGQAPGAKSAEGAGAGVGGAWENGKTGGSPGSSGGGGGGGTGGTNTSSSGGTDTTTSGGTNTDTAGGGGANTSTNGQTCQDAASACGGAITDTAGSGGTNTSTDPRAKKNVGAPVDASPWKDDVAKATKAMMAAMIALLACSILGWLAKHVPWPPVRMVLHGLAIVAAVAAMAAAAIVMMEGIILMAKYGQWLYGGIYLVTGGLMEYAAIKALQGSINAFKGDLKAEKAAMDAKAAAQQKIADQNLAKTSVPEPDVKATGQAEPPSASATPDGASANPNAGARQMTLDEAMPNAPRQMTLDEAMPGGGSPAAGTPGSVPQPASAAAPPPAAETLASPAAPPAAPPPAPATITAPPVATPPPPVPGVSFTGAEVAKTAALGAGAYVGFSALQGAANAPAGSSFGQTLQAAGQGAVGNPLVQGAKTAGEGVVDGITGLPGVDTATQGAENLATSAAPDVVNAQTSVNNAVSNQIDATKKNWNDLSAQSAGAKGGGSGDPTTAGKSAAKKSVANPKNANGAASGNGGSAGSNGSAGASQTKDPAAANP